MSRKTFWKKNKTAVIVLGAVIGLAIFGLMFLPGGPLAALTNPPGTEPPTTPGTFDVLAWDGGRGIELPSDSFGYTLYGVEGNDLTDFGMYDVLDTGTNIGSIAKGDLDTDYQQFVVKSSGVVVKGDWDADDPKIEPIDETYDHEYYERWFVLNPSAVNYLVFYETPSATGMIVVDSNDFTAATGPIAAKTNITIIAATNASQPFARYVTGANYANEGNDAPSIEVRFTYYVQLSDVLMNGATKTRVNQTTLRFTFGVLSTTPSFFKLMWADDLVPSGKSIDRIHLLFGSTNLATFA